MTNKELAHALSVRVDDLRDWLRAKAGLPDAMTGRKASDTAPGKFAEREVPAELAEALLAAVAGIGRDGSSERRLVRLAAAVDVAAIGARIAAAAPKAADAEAVEEPAGA